MYNRKGLLAVNATLGLIGRKKEDKKRKLHMREIEKGKMLMP